MLRKIKDIKNALKSESYMSALALTLTLPDICGKVVYPELNSGERYKKWYDEYITKYNENNCILNAEKCYKLRCAYLHEGSIKDIPEIDEFEFRVSRSSGETGGVSSFSELWIDTEKKRKEIRLDIKQFCFEIYQAAENFYEEKRNDKVFSDDHITFLD